MNSGCVGGSLRSDRCSGRSAMAARTRSGSSSGSTPSDSRVARASSDRTKPSRKWPVPTKACGSQRRGHRLLEDVADWARGVRVFLRPRLPGRCQIAHGLVGHPGPLERQDGGAVRHGEVVRHGDAASGIGTPWPHGSNCHCPLGRACTPVGWWPHTPQCTGACSRSRLAAYRSSTAAALRRRSTGRSVGETDMPMPPSTSNVTLTVPAAGRSVTIPCCQSPVRRPSAVRLAKRTPVCVSGR